jgi:hypothetical protein
MGEKTTQNGRCHDCAQGVFHKDAGFSLYEDGDYGHWYCLYCGSNHVTITLEDGSEVLSQGNLYDF